MRLIALLLLFVSVSVASKAQKMEGEITYEKVYHYTKMYSRLTYLSTEEKDRMKMTWGKDDEYKQDMKLFFNEQKSLYTYSKTQENNEAGYSWTEKEYKVYRDIENEKRTDIIEMLGKIYIVEDTVRAPKWKVMNKIKEINGYMCMMAVTEDTIKNQQITAWFADNIPVSIGPELYGGLPGLILELDINEGDIVITAKKVEMKAITEDINIPKKLKGKKITEPQYNTLVSTHIRDSMKAHRNPFWSIPY
jgi:GLPGLI family protein